MDNKFGTFKFRAECESDIIRLRKVIDDKPIKEFIIIPLLFGEIEVEVLSAIPLEEFRDLMRQVIDGHVMVQTLNTAEKYTGERNYDL